MSWLNCANSIYEIALKGFLDKWSHELFESSKLLGWCRDFVQSLDDTRASPNIVQRDRLLKKQIGTLTITQTQLFHSIKIERKPGIIGAQSNQAGL